MAELAEPQPLPADVERAFEELRHSHRLRALTEEESGNGIDRLPSGVFGFTYSPALENFPLFKDRDLRCYESHKLTDGSVVLVGFLTAAEREAFETSAEETTIHLFAEPMGDADQLVCVPMSRVRKHVEYSQRTGKGLELLVAPAG